ncbi:MAG: patatin-like phospholipase family protein [Erythrobacter sp.]
MGLQFDCIAMQGGGIRCFWQAGFLAVASQIPRVREVPIFAVSAAAGIAAAHAAGRLTHAVERFRAAASANPSNVHWRNLLSAEPVFPHSGIYRRVLDEVFDASAVARLRAGPGLSVLLARPWPGLPTPVVVGLSGALYRAKKSMDPARWSRLAQAAGFRAQYVDVRTCDRPEVVAQLILASSCTPPFTPVLSWEGRRVMDGGLLESVPISPLAAAGRRALVLMTRAPRLGESFVDGHEVVWPSRPLAVSAWDYTNPQAIDDAVALGRLDAATFVERNAFCAAV